MPKGLIVKLLLLVIVGAGIGAIMQSMLSPGKAPAVVFRPSDWSLLSDDEQKILQPLAAKWEAMDSTQQEKWRAIAKKYPVLSPREQQKIQRRMTRWAGIAPEQRAVARKKFQTYKKKKPEEQERVRSAWQSRQAAKEQGTSASSPAGNESPANEGVATKGTGNNSSVTQPDPASAAIGLSTESQK